MRTPQDRRELIVIGLLAFLAGVGLPIVSLVRSICGTCAATDWLDPDYIFAVTPVVAGMLAAVLLRGPDRRRVGLLHLAVAIGVVVEGILLVILRSDGPFLLMMAFPVGLPFLFASCLIATVAYFAASIASGYVSRRWVTAAVAASFIAVIGTLFAQSWWPRELPPKGAACASVGRRHLRRHRRRDRAGRVQGLRANGLGRSLMPPWRNHCIRQGWLVHPAAGSRPAVRNAH